MDSEKKDVVLLVVVIFLFYFLFLIFLGKTKDKQYYKLNSDLFSCIII